VATATQGFTEKPMDIYLPNDFYQLRDDLPDWREAASQQTPNHHADAAAAPDACADPSWKVI
jgi:hypothetical protein